MIGLTGGIGCGKSTALGIFESLGAETFDSDSIVKELLDGDGEVRRCLTKRLGERIVGDLGKVDRERLAGIVFNDSEELRWLENLLHPLVRNHWETRVRAAPETFWVVEIPLLFEKKLEKLFDFTVCVSASQSLQLARLREKGLTVDQARLRIDRQLPLDEKLSRADFVLSNNGSVEFLREQVSILKTEILPS